MVGESFLETIMYNTCDVIWRTMSSNILSWLTNKNIDYTQPIKLYDDVNHQVYWVGVYTGGEEIECNTYLVVNGGEGFLIEPGGYDRFSPVFQS